MNYEKNTVIIVSEELYTIFIHHSRETMRIYIQTLGCKVNQYESQAVAAMLREKGWEVSEEPEGADVIMVNTCAVTAEAVRKSRQTIRNLEKKAPGARVAICGCWPQTEPEAARAFGADIVFGSGEKHRLAEAIMSGGSADSVDRAFSRRVFEPLPSGSGNRIEFPCRDSSGLPPDCLQAIEQAVEEVVTAGSPSGYPLTDTRIAVLQGSTTMAEPSEPAFLTAARNALSDALAQAVLADEAAAEWLLLALAHDVKPPLAVALGKQVESLDEQVEPLVLPGESAHGQKPPGTAVGGLAGHQRQWVVDDGGVQLRVVGFVALGIVTAQHDGAVELAELVDVVALALAAYI